MEVESEQGYFQEKKVFPLQASHLGPFFHHDSADDVRKGLTDQVHRCLLRVLFRDNDCRTMECFNEKCIVYFWSQDSF